MAPVTWAWYDSPTGSKLLESRASPPSPYILVSKLFKHLMYVFLKCQLMRVMSSAFSGYYKKWNTDTLIPIKIIAPKEVIFILREAAKISHNILSENVNWYMTTRKDLVHNFWYLRASLKCSCWNECMSVILRTTSFYSRIHEGHCICN